MNAYTIGNLLGRLFVSYLLILCFIWLVSRFDLRLALRRSHRWYSLLGIPFIFSIGFIGAISRLGS